MNYKTTLLLLDLFLFPNLALAQVSPNSINSFLLEKSYNAILNTENIVVWEMISVPDSLKELLGDKLKAKSQIVDTLFIGIVSTKYGERYIIPDIARSRSDQFSYLLYIDQSKSIVGVDILEYHENYGYEIDYPFFRKQFYGKQQADEIIFGRSIQNISGATISARSITYAIHDLLLILNYIQLP